MCWPALFTRPPLGGKRKDRCAGEPLEPSLPPRVVDVLSREKRGPTRITSREEEGREPEEGGDSEKSQPPKIIYQSVSISTAHWEINEEAKPNQIKSNGSNPVADWPADRCVFRLQRSLCGSRLYIYPPFPSSPLSSRLSTWPSSINLSVELTARKRKKPIYPSVCTYRTFLIQFRFLFRFRFRSRPAPAPLLLTHAITKLSPPPSARKPASTSLPPSARHLTACPSPKSARPCFSGRWMTGNRKSPSPNRGTGEKCRLRRAQPQP